MHNLTCYILVLLKDRDMFIIVVMAPITFKPTTVNNLGYTALNRKASWKQTVIVIFLQFNAHVYVHLQHVMRKPAVCICDNKDADQLPSNCVADQRVYFRYMDSTIPILSKSEISSL